MMIILSASETGSAVNIDISRAQRSTKWCAADPGSSQSQHADAETAKTPDQRCTVFTLHRIRGTYTNGKMPA
jgi:hypothetical protein